MKNSAVFSIARPTRLSVASACIVGAVLFISGCASVKDQYAASADAQQRMAADAAADTKAGAAVDTQSTYLRLVEQMQKEDLWFASLAHIDALEQRWGISPDSTRVRAEALRQTGQAVAAEAAYRRLIDTPMESAGYRGLGLLAGMRGDYVEASRFLSQAQRRTPTDPLLLSDLGYANLRAGMVEEARLPLMQALQLKPDSAQARANLALYLEVTQQREQATALMNENRMSEATRLAIRDAAQQMLLPGRASVPVAAVAPVGSLASRRDETMVSPLALKPSRWSETISIRTAGQTGSQSVSSAPPLSLNSTSQGIP
jgi:Flp pilus assembly protein TadD